MIDFLNSVALRSAFVVTAAASTWGAFASQPAELSPPTEMLVVDLVCPRKPCPTQVELQVVEGGAGGGSRELPVQPVTLEGGHATVLLPPDLATGLQVRASAPGFWSEALRLDAGDSDRYELALWPAATLRGQFQPKDSQESPDEIHIRLRASSERAATSGTQPPRPSEIVCSLGEGKTLQDCSVPAGDWNLRMVAPPFAPVFLWGRRTGLEEVLDLGTVELREGGSIFGHMMTESGPVDPRRARVWVRPVSSGDRSDRARERKIDQQILLGEVLRGGDLQFVGVAPGLYQIEASFPGFFNAKQGPVRVVEGRWTQLEEPMVLEPPVFLNVLVEPNEAPYDAAWKIALYPKKGSGRSKVDAQGETDPTGYWKSSPLRRGSYLLLIEDGRGNSVARREVELSSGEELLTVEIPLIYVEGTAYLGKRPIEATVWFGGRTAEERVEAVSDESGEFFAILPRDGEWRVDLRSESPPVRSRGLTVQVEPVEDLGLAEVEIHVPDTALVGKVVTERGTPPEQAAHVNLFPLGEGVGVTESETDDVGEFELRGMPVGKYMVSAETSDASSGPAQVDIQEDQQVPLSLVLRPKGALEGRVVSSAGPVPNAQVRVYFLAGSGLGAQMVIPRQQTGPGGRFRVTRPAAASGSRLITMASGYALDVTRFSNPQSDQQEVEILVDRASGSLDLQGLGELKTRGRAPEVGLLMVNEEPIDLPRIMEWARMHDEVVSESGGLEIPAMPPGHYALCWLTVQEALLVLDGAALPTGDRCADGFLAAGGNLTLSLP